MRLPSLGPHGEGWFAAQLVLFAGLALAGLAGPVWGGWALRATFVAGGAILVGGGILAVRGVLDLGSSLTPFPAPRSDARFVDTGAYSIVRHPIYAGLIVGSLGWGLATASPLALAGTIALSVFFDLKSRREEAWLIDRFCEYPAYQARTCKLLPWIY
jgi:protein-S-isoprenylcysteine O-methyltransferase Ste14